MAPQAIPLIGAAALAGATAAAGVTAAGITILGVTLSAAAFGAVVAIGTLAVGLLSVAFAPKPKGFNASAFSQEASGRTQMVRQPITTRKLILGGWVRVSGPLVQLTTTHDKERLHYVFPVCANEVTDFGTVYLDGRPIYRSQIGGEGWVTAGPFADLVRVHFAHGSDDQAANSVMVASLDYVDETWRGLGIAYLYLQIKRDRNKFPQIPQCSVYVKGRALYDPRDGGQDPADPATWKWSDNAKLVEAAYLTTPAIRGGMARAGTFGAAWDRMDDDLLIAAANICDEMAAVKPLTVACSVAANRVTLDSTELRVAIGQHFTEEGSGGFAGYVSNIIDSGFGSDDVVFELAATLAGARAGETLTLPSGATDITFDQEPRYTANGVIDSKDTPFTILRGLRTSHLGAVYPSGGKWRSFAGAWRTPESDNLTLSDLDGPLKVQTRTPGKERVNGVFGTYVSTWNDDQPQDYPAVAPANYLDADNGVRRWHDLPLAWTNTPSAAQRIATLYLQRARLERKVQAPFKWTAMRLRALDTVGLEVPHRGWDPLTFEVGHWQPVLRPSKSGNGPPYLGIDMELQEASADAWTYDETGQTVVLPRQRANLPSAFEVAAPAAVALESGTPALFVKKDGTVVSRITGLITASPDATVDHYRVTYKLAAADDAEYQAVDPVPAGGTLRFTIFEVEEGLAYDVRVVAVNYLGQTSDPVTVAGHLVAGKSALPGDMTGLQAQQNGNVVVVRYDQVPDLDLSGYELRIIERASV